MDRKINIPIFLPSIFLSESDHLRTQQPLKMKRNTFGQHGRIVAAFEDADDPAAGVGSCNVADDLRQRSEIFRLKPQRADRICAMAVEAGAQQDELRADTIGQLGHGRFESLDILSTRRAEFERQIELRAERGAFANLTHVAGPWIKGPAMDREESDLFVAPEDLLGAVAVMHIPVDDQNAIESEFVDRQPGADRHVVKQAKAHRRGGTGVVPRRANETKGRRIFPANNPLDGIRNRPGRQQRHVERFCANDRIDFNRPSTAAGELRDRGDIVRIMHPRQSRRRNRTELGVGATPIEPGRIEMARDRDEPFRSLRMQAGRVIEKSRVAIKESHLMISLLASVHDLDIRREVDVT
jgi:hypothetical protein